MRDLIIELRHAVHQRIFKLRFRWFRRRLAARWRIAYLLNRSDRFCWANLVSWAVDGHPGQLTTVTDVAGCKAEGRDPKCGACYCGKFMTTEMRAAQDQLNAAGTNGVRPADDDPWAKETSRD